MTEPILITGCARSGTSMVAGCINLSGAFGGELSGPNPSNKKGMFENSYIRDSMVKPYLSAIGMDPFMQFPLPKWEDIILHTLWADQIKDLMHKQGYTDGPWFYKGAKMALTFPLWDFAFPKAHWIIVRRDSEAIINSCLKTRFMRAYDTREGWQTWINAHIVAFERMKVSGIDVIEIQSEHLIKGDFEQLKEVLEHVGLTYDKEVLKAFIEPELWHG